MVDVIQFSNTLSASDGGPARHALEVNYALNSIGVPTQLFAIHKSDDSILPAYLQRPDSPATPPAEGQDALRIGNLLRLLTLTRTWIIHGYYLIWIPPVAAAGLLLGKKILIMPHGALTSYDRGRKKARKLFFHAVAGWWLNRASSFVVATENEASEVSEIAGVRRVNTVGAGAAIAASSGDHDRDEGCIRLLSMSRIAPKKRIDRAIRALAEVRRSGTNASLTIAGTGDPTLIANLRQLCDAEGVTEFTAFVGQVEGALKTATYTQSDIFVLLSEDENFGIGLADALAMGLPAVVSDRVSAAHGLPSAAVTVLRDTTPRSVASAVLSMSTEYTMRRLAAMEAAESHFSWNAVAQRWRAVIETGLPDRNLS